MDDNIFSQATTANKERKESAGHSKTKRNRRTGFKPPIKKTDVLPTHTDLSSAEHSQQSVTERGRKREGGGQAKRRKQNDTQDDGDRTCHTVLSYCEEENVDNGLDPDTQPLSMFSGERSEVRDEEIGELDDLLFQPGDLFSRTDDTLSKLDDRCFVLDDPLSKLDDPFSLSSDPPSLAQEEIGSVSEQVVPSGQSEQDEEDVRKEVEDDNMETDSEGDENKGEETRKLSFPRRQFKVAQSTRCYNLELLPKHYQKGTRKSSMSSRCGREHGSDSRAVPGRPAVNWATSVSVLVGKAGKEGSREDSGEQRTLSVYEVPLSAGDLRERGREGRVAGSCRGSKAVLSMSKLDLSLSCRSREEQLAIDLEVLEVISRTREEIRVLRAKYVAMTPPCEVDTTLPQSTHHHSHPSHHHPHKPQLQVTVVTEKPRKVLQQSLASLPREQ